MSNTLFPVTIVTKRKTGLRFATFHTAVPNPYSLLFSGRMDPDTLFVVNASGAAVLVDSSALVNLNAEDEMFKVITGTREKV